MNKTIKQIAILGMFLVSAPQALGSLITNGNFGSSGACNLAAWEQFGDVSTISAPGNCSAELNVNHFSDFEAELWQEVSFDIDTDYNLAVDFNVGTSSFNTVFDDVFSISLLNNDFDLVELFSMNITSDESFSKSLVINADELASYANQEWSLSFYLYDDYIEDENNSFVSINNVYIEEVVTDVPEPSSLALLALGFAGLMSRRKISNELVRKSINK